MNINEKNIIVVAAFIRTGLIKLSNVKGSQKNKDRLVLLLRHEPTSILKKGK